MLTVLGNLDAGYNEITDMKNKFPDMMMDIGIQVMSEGGTFEFVDDDKETALLVLDGAFRFEWEGGSQEVERRSLFDENPAVLHVCCKTKVKVLALSNGELLVQKTLNSESFPSRFYSQADITTDIFGENVWNDTARRMVRTVFDYNNAPYSNMVMGEVINFPGKWSSYIPHGHDQPEVYYYRFDKDSGFGAAFIGDNAYKIVDNSALMIPGGPTHPQVSAPGYAMWYCWMIRHIDGNPWTTRDNDPRYTWLLEKDPVIWGRG